MLGSGGGKYLVLSTLFSAQKIAQVQVRDGAGFRKHIEKYREIEKLGPTQWYVSLLDILWGWTVQAYIRIYFHSLKTKLKEIS